MQPYTLTRHDPKLDEAVTCAGCGRALLAAELVVDVDNVGTAHVDCAALDR